MILDKKHNVTYPDDDDKDQGDRSHPFPFLTINWPGVQIYRKVIAGLGLGLALYHDNLEKREKTDASLAVCIISHLLICSK